MTEEKEIVCSVQDAVFRPPERNADSEIVIRYLTQDRGIEKTVLEPLLKTWDIYEDRETHNPVFLGRDENRIPRYAAIFENEFSEISGSDKAYSFSCGSIGKEMYVFEDPISLLSFQCLYPESRSEGCFVSLGGFEDTAMLANIDRYPWIDTIYLCLDNDNASDVAAAKLVQAIPKDIAVTRFMPIRKDWNSVLREKDELDGHYCLDPVVFHEAAPSSSIPVIRMSDIELKPVDWLWYPYIPFGKLTIVQGNPGEGKTTFALRLAAACTTTALLPGMQEHEPMNVIYQTAEDGLGDTIKPRLMEAQADLDRVILIDETKSGLSLTDERIEKAINENHVRLVIFDPIQAYIGNRTDINRANEIRPIMRTLSEIADRTGCAILLIGHLNKSSSASSAYRGLGSIDFRAAVRSVLLIGRVKSDPTIRVICHDKSSLTPEGKSMAFSLDPERGFEWIGEYEITAEDLLSGKSVDTYSKQEQAKELILNALLGSPEISAEELDALAMDAGIGERTLRIAKSELRDSGILYAKRRGKSWFYGILNEGVPEQEAKPPPFNPKVIDWSDPMQRMIAIMEKLGFHLVGIENASLTPEETETAKMKRQTADTLPVAISPDDSNTTDSISIQ